MKRLILINVSLVVLFNIVPKPTIQALETTTNEIVVQEEVVTSRSLDVARQVEATDYDVVVTSYSEDLVDYIKAKENFSSTPYLLDGETYYTIGYGTHSKEIKETDVVTEEQADKMLRTELNADVEYVLKYMSYLDENLTQSQVNALTDFVYNSGLGSLQQLTNFKTRSIEEIEEHITSYIHSNGKVLNGLVTRRNDELKMLKGEF